MLAGPVAARKADAGDISHSVAEWPAARHDAAMSRHPSFLFALGLAWLAGCAAADAGAGGPVGSPGAALPPGARATLEQVVAAARADAARRSGRAAEGLQLVSAERVTWPDGSLGCPRPGMAYTMALVPGFRIVLSAAGERYDYHADQRGQLVLCPPGRAADPVDGGTR